MEGEERYAKQSKKGQNGMKEREREREREKASAAIFVHPFLDGNQTERFER